MKNWFILVFLLAAPVCLAQSATVNWVNQHQVIDGFGANDVNMNINPQLTTAQQAFFFGTGAGQLGLSVLRVGITNGGQEPGNCLTVSVSCEGYAATDIRAAASYGVRVIGTPFSPPAAYTTNGSTACTANGGNGQLALAHYQDFANWIVNFSKSVQSYGGGTSLYAVSVQNEPEYCESYDSAVYSSSQLDTSIKNNLGPTLSADGLSTMIFMPDSGRYSNVSKGDACATDSACASYVSAFDFHDYDAIVTAPHIVNDTPYPSSRAAGKKFWVAEASCQSGGGGPNFCNASFDPSIANALDWAAVIDQRLVVDNVNMWNYWWFVVDTGGNNGEGLVTTNGIVAQRAYVMGQYARFVRPGYHRIDATHIPQPGISVSAYQDTPTNTLVIIATNYNSSPVPQTFNITNAPNFTSVTPYVTSASQNIQAQSMQSVSGNSFTYALPADSVTTFVGASSGSAMPAMPKGKGSYFRETDEEIQRYPTASTRVP